jgi:MFS family permease
MKQQSQTVFYVERMQPTWLMKKWQRQLYSGLITGPICGLLVGLDFLYVPSLFPFLVFTVALIVGLLFGWLSETEVEKKETTPTTSIWRGIRQSLANVLASRVRIGISGGLLVGIITALFAYLISPNVSFGIRITSALGYGLIDGIVMGLSLGLAIKPEKRIEPLEALGWSWTGIRKNILMWLLIGVGVVLLQGFIFALPFMTSNPSLWLATFLTSGLWSVSFLVLVITLVNGVTGGLSKRVLDEQHIVTPNQGTWRSFRYGVVIAIICGVTRAASVGATTFIGRFWLPLHMGIPKKPAATDYWIVGMMSHLLGFYPTAGQAFWTLDALFRGLYTGMTLGLAAGLYCGGAAYMQHFVLRFLLWCTRRVPFSYPRFLDYAAERILLRKVGGGYIFIHRLLLEYFASL